MKNKECKIIDLVTFSKMDFSKGHWRYKKSTNVLEIKKPYPYEVDLDRLKTYRDFVDWINQLSGKSWITSEMIYDFIQKVRKHTDLKIWKS
jgi:predicted NAD-dependent protein-ADP-ribosyltransferase YbiA (DUF1768 family)